MMEAETTIPNPAIQPTIVGQRPTLPMPRAPPYNGAHFMGPPSSAGWGPTAVPPQHMHMWMPMQNYPYMAPGATSPGPPGTMPHEMGRGTYAESD